MPDSFPALAVLKAAAEQSRPLSATQRRQLAEISGRLLELCAAARTGAGMLDQAHAAGSAPVPAGDTRARRRLHQALTTMFRPI